MLYMVALNIMRNPHDAQDAVQTTFEKMARSTRQSNDMEEVKAWLITCIQNMCRDALRRKGRHRTVPLEEVTNVVENEGENAADALFERNELERALMSLPDDDRTAVIMRYVMDCSYEEIAHVIESTPGATRTRVSRALKRLREGMEAEK